MSMPRPVASLPRTSLRAWLARHQAAPLGPSTRRFMGAAFGADFGAVRVHTGPEASAACRALGAEAFTFGRHVVFGEGRYEPASPAGRRLLAHELVHVLQQRAAPRRAEAGPVPIGDPGDACEAEADRLAAEALDGGLRSAVTPDPAGAIRRLKTTVLEAGVQLDVSSAGAKPGVTLTSRDSRSLAVLHLTKNSAPHVQRKALSTTADYLAASAIRITGTVAVLADTKSDVTSSWDYRIIQVVHPIRDVRSYAGRTPTDGSMVLDLSTPPGMKFGYMLDSLDGMMPYAETDKASVTNVGPGSWLVSAFLADHPNGDVHLVWQNHAASDADNYLFSAYKWLHFVTAFVLVDSATGGIKPLISVEWDAIWDVRFDYTSSTSGGLVANPRMMESDFRVGAVTKGDPADGKAAALIKNPPTSASSNYKEAYKRAQQAAYVSTVNNGNVTAVKDWTPFVPKNFFR